MKSDVISIYSDLKGSIEAIREAEMFSAYHDLDKKQKMYIRLLSEESISMVHGILNGFKGDFWLESEQTEKGLLCRICVSADANVSDGQEEKLLAVSSTGKNEDAKGIMGKIRQVLRWSMQHTDDEEMIRRSWFEMGCYGSHMESSATVNYYWSLANYRSNVEDNPKAGEEERDELEKSIISKLSDEVKVGIRSGNTEVIIEKYFKS